MRALLRATYRPLWGAMAENIEWSEADGFLLAGTYVGPPGSA